MQSAGHRHAESGRLGPGAQGFRETPGNPEAAGGGGVPVPSPLGGPAGP